ncbi:MAG TPA: prephenate dehydratase [bacterium]
MMKTIAYLGPAQTYTHLAAQARFGSRARYVHAPTVEDVFHAVEREQADCGVVPVENSLGGAVTHTLDRFIDFKHSPVRIRGEIQLEIRHHLITRPGVEPRDVALVLSHPQVLTQCASWLQAHLPWARRSETLSSAEAVQRLLARPGRRNWAAIGSRELADGRRLKAVRIHSPRENRTRFLILALREPPRGRRNKTSLMFALKDKPGALHDSLVPFKRHGINLTKIESRPSRRRAWEYLFFVDFEGHVSDPRVQRALRSLRRRTSEVQILGSYPV